MDSAVLGQALLPGERKAWRSDGKGQDHTNQPPFFGGPFSTQCSLSRGPGDVCSPVSLVSLTQPPADLRSRDGAIQYPAPSPLALPLPWPVAQSMVLVKTRKYLYKNNLKNMVCQIIKAAEHLRSFQLDWEMQCCFPKALCDAGGACGCPSPVGCRACPCGFSEGIRSSLMWFGDRGGQLSLVSTQATCCQEPQLGMRLCQPPVSASHLGFCTVPCIGTVTGAGEILK